jgi:hypothetical protein
VAALIADTGKSNAVGFSCGNRSDTYSLSSREFQKMKWLDRIPFAVLVPVAVVLGLAPFAPEPHLWEKLKMLFAGTLVRPIDIFDLFLHGTPLVLLLLKLVFSRSGTSGPA